MTGQLNHLGRNQHSAGARIEAGAAKGIRYGLWKLGNDRFERGNFADALEFYKMAAAQGLMLASRAVAWMYANGIGAQVDMKLATFYYEVAAESGCGRSAFEAAVSHLYGRGGGEPNLQAATDYLRRAIIANTPRAKSYLAFVEATGELVPLESNGQSLLRLVELCRDGNYTADYAVGCFWLEGLPGWVDLERAVSAFSHAAEQGCIKSKLELGRRVLAGDGGVEMDAKRAVRLFAEAADDGCLDAMVDLAAFLFEGRYGMPADHGQAKAWLEKAIVGGSVTGKVMLAKLLIGTQDRQDVERAKGLLEQAADSGSCEAAHLLARMIEEHPSLWADQDRYDRLIVAAEAGSTDAMLMAARDTADQTEKMFWLQCAIDDGSIFGTFALACELWSLKTKESSVEALAFWKHAARLGSLEAVDVLADLYLTGNRVKRNPGTAAQYLGVLASNGDLNAKATLDKLQARGLTDAPQSEDGKVLSIAPTNVGVGT